MTLQQLQYVIAIVEHGSISETAKQLYVAQPTLSSAVRTLEEEFGIVIFHRSARGIALTEDGREFLSYARQVVEQADLLHQHYGAAKQTRQRCSISTQHYAFAVDAFVRLIQRLSPESYEFTLRETRTHEIMEDVRNFDSEIGILYVNDFNQKVLYKLFRDCGLEFHELLRCGIYVYLWKGHPLANRKLISLEDLREYPCLSFDQGAHGSFYFAEEVLSTYEYKRIIKANDRATLLNLMIGLNAYTLCSGIICEELNGSDYLAVPFEADSVEENSVMEIGYITKKSSILSEIGARYIKEVEEYLLQAQRTGQT